MLLQLGATGEEVKHLQQMLGLEADGQFGPHTREALQQWQQSHGLQADGIAGDQTWNRLLAYQNAGTFIQQLGGLLPDIVIQQIPAVLKPFSITQSLRLTHLLAQCAHESSGFTHTEENLNYSADRLQAVFPSRFPGGDLNASYAHQPVKIANRAYANKNGNGDEASGDGYRFHGRGYIQLTGRSNYQAFDATVSDDLMQHPELVATTYALASSAFYFQRNALWNLCDKGISDEVIREVTQRVNGPACLGLSDRIQWFRRIGSCLHIC